MPYLNDYCLDALVEKVREATRLFICSAEPTTYAEASSTFMVGYKNSPTMGAVSDRTGGGRKTTVSAVTDGVVNTGGGGDSDMYWALADHANSRLLAVNAVTNDQVLIDGNTWTMAAFDVGVPDAA
jgi:hypothetical protein